MTREELIKYFEQSLECISHMENSDCDYVCKNCDVGVEADLFDLCHSVIEILKEDVMGGSVSLIDGHIDEVRDEKLKPCPICGGEAEFRPTIGDTHGFCTCKYKRCVEQHFTKNINDAILDWNTRIPINK